MKNSDPHLEDQSSHSHHGHNGSCSCDHEESALIARLRSPSLFAATAFCLAGFVMEFLLHASKTSIDLTFGAAMLLGGWFLVPGAIKALLRFRANINLLMLIASIGAAFIGAWGEAAVVVTLFGVAEWLEGFSVGRARKAISKLLNIAPAVARVVTPSGIVEKPAVEISVGEQFEIRPGERIALDAIVRSGNSHVNQAPITGEPLPIEKNPGDEVFAGTLNTDGRLVAEATKPYRDSTLARIITMVEEAQEQRAPTQKFIERFAEIYTPLVPLLALLVFIIPVLVFNGAVDIWAYRAFIILVIACPCALVIATPVSIICGLASLAHQGILVKGGSYLELLGKLKAVAFDKTGTITEGKPTVLEVTPFPKDSSNAIQTILQIAASLDVNSTHPLAQSIVAYTESQNIPLESASNFKNESGRGVRATIANHEYFAGNHRMAHDLGVCTPELEATLAEIESKGRTVVVVGHIPHGQCTGEVIGIIAVGDAIRPEAKSAIQSLRKAGVQNLLMLSGDNQRTADVVAEEVDLDAAFGNLLPDEKAEKIKALQNQYGYTAMIGDGINDAPALASASLGIAMGVAGSDTAIETADVALMRDDLTQVANAIKQGRRVNTTIRANIAFALGLKALFLILAIFGYTTLWLAILADTGATLLVVANAMRLLTKANRT